MRRFDERDYNNADSLKWKVNALRDAVAEIYKMMPGEGVLEKEKVDKVANLCSMVLALTAESK